MKKIKMLFLSLALFVALVGNTFAIEPSGPSDGLLSAAISFVAEQMYSMLGPGSDDCPLRQCQTCHPNGLADGSDDGNCRPRDNN